MKVGSSGMKCSQKWSPRSKLHHLCPLRFESVGWQALCRVSSVLATKRLSLVAGMFWLHLTRFFSSLVTHFPLPELCVSKRSLSLPLSRWRRANACQARRTLCGDSHHGAARMFLEPLCPCQSALAVALHKCFLSWMNQLRNLHVEHSRCGAVRVGEPSAQIAHVEMLSPWRWRRVNVYRARRTLLQECASGAGFRGRRGTLSDFVSARARFWSWVLRQAQYLERVAPQVIGKKLGGVLRRTCSAKVCRK